MCQHTSWNERDEEIEMAVEEFRINLVFPSNQADPRGGWVSAEEKDLSSILLRALVSVQLLQVVRAQMADSGGTFQSKVVQHC